MDNRRVNQPTNWPESLNQTTVSCLKPWRKELPFVQGKPDTLIAILPQQWQQERAHCWLLSWKLLPVKVAGVSTPNVPRLLPKRKYLAVGDEGGVCKWLGGKKKLIRQGAVIKSLYFLFYFIEHISSQEKSENLYREKFHTPSLSTLSRRRMDGEKFAYLHRSTRPVCHWRKSNCKMASFCSKLLSPRSCHRRRKLPQHAKIGENWHWAHTFPSPPSQVKDEQCRCHTMKGELDAWSTEYTPTYKSRKMRGNMYTEWKEKEIGSSRKEQIYSFYIRREDRLNLILKESICIQFEHLHVVVFSYLCSAVTKDSTLVDLRPRLRSRRPTIDEGKSAQHIHALSNAWSCSVYVLLQFRLYLLVVVFSWSRTNLIMTIEPL